MKDYWVLVFVCVWLLYTLQCVKTVTFSDEGLSARGKVHGKSSSYAHLTYDPDDVKIQKWCQGIHGNCGSTTGSDKGEETGWYNCQYTVTVTGSYSSSDHTLMAHNNKTTHTGMYAQCAAIVCQRVTHSLFNIWDLYCNTQLWFKSICVH